MIGSSRGPRSSRDRVHAALEHRGLRPSRTADDFMALCPVHEDGSPSLHVTWSTRGGGAGKVLLKCFGCEAPAADIADALSLTEDDLFDEPLPPRPTPSPASARVGRSPRERLQGKGRGKPGRLPDRIAKRSEAPAQHHSWVDVEDYVYVDGDAAVVQTVIRRECTTCERRHKEFVQRFADPHRPAVMQKRKPAGFSAVLYRLPEVRDAVAAHEPVWVMEGEKDVHTAERLDLVATTNPGGGATFPEDLADELADASVCVVLDRDDTGWARGVHLHNLLTSKGARVRLLIPVPTAAKADFTDHVEAGHTVDDLVEVSIEEVRAWAAVAGVSRQLRRMQESEGEVQARLERAEQADTAGKDTAAQTERRYAQRWAQNSVLVWERLSAELDTVRTLAHRAGSNWAGEALALAESAWRQGRSRARDLHERTGLALPGELREIPDPPPAGSPTGGGTGDHPARRDHDSGEESQREERGHRHSRLLPGQPRYAVVDGCLVEIRPVKKDRRDRASGEFVEEWGESVRPVLNLDVRIVATERPAADHDGEEQVPLMGRESAQDVLKVGEEAPPTHIVFAFTHPLIGREERVRVEFDRAIDSSWLHSYAHLGLVYDSRPAGRARVWDAIRQTSRDAVDSTLHRSTGWRDLPEYGWGYVHARGAITAKGHVNIPVSLDGPMARFDLPDPTDDGNLIGRVFREHTVAMLDRLPARISSVLVGHMFRAVLNPNGWTPVLVGSPGSFKTGVAALAMHYLGEAWDRKKPAVSLSGNGDTFNTIRYKLHVCKDAVLFGDDLAPTKDLVAAQRLLEEMARLIHNQEERGRMDRTGQKASKGTPPRGSGLLTSEVMPRPGSGAERLVPIPLLPNEVDVHQVIQLDRFDSRYGRALLMSSYLRWVASDLPQCRERAKTVAAEFKTRLQADGHPLRQSDAYAELWAGWDLLSVFLMDTEAITAEERTQLLARIRLALLEAMALADDPDVPTSTGARVREMIVHGLATGVAHVVDIHTGDCPQWPLAGRLGHRRSPTQGGSALSMATGETNWKIEARGFPLGWVNISPRPQDGGTPELLIERLALEQLLKQVAHSLSDAPEMDAATAMRELHKIGVLRADETGQRLRFTRDRTIHCQVAADGSAPRRQRKIVLDLHALLGEIPGSPEGPVGGGASPAGGPDGNPEPAEGPPLADQGGPFDDQLPLGPQPSGDTGGPAATIGEQLSAPSRTPAPSDQVFATTAEEPSPVPIHHEPQQYRDGEGHAAYPRQLAERTPCLLCPLPSGISFEGDPLHILCWERSTAASRAQARSIPAGTTVGTRPAAPDPAPVTAPVGQSHTAGGPPAADVHPAPAKPQLDHPETVDARSAAAEVHPLTGRRTWDGRTELTDSAVAVCHAEGVVLGNGDVLALPEHLEHLGHLAQLGGRLKLGSQAQRRHLEAGTIVITDDLAARMGLPVSELPADPTRREEALQQISRDHPFVTAAIHAGWKIRATTSGSPGLRGWMRMQHEQHPTVRVAFASVISGSVVDGLPAGPRKPGRGAGPGPADLARRLQLFADQMGYPWRVSGGATGIDMMIGLRWGEHDRLFPIGRQKIPPMDGYVESELNWSRPLLDSEKARRFLHVYDRGGSWGTGIPGHELPIGEAVHLPTGGPFDPRVPGFHRVHVPASPTWGMPNPVWVAAHTRQEDGSAWVPTPSLTLAQDLNIEVPVLESWVWPEHARLLDSWYTRFSKARAALDTGDLNDQVAREMVKETYTRGIGTMMSAETWVGRAGYFPERAYLIIAKARSNLLRRVHQIGSQTEQWPVAVHTDSIAYVSDEPDPVTAWPGDPKHLGRGMGQLRPERSGLLAEHISRLGGPRWDGKTKLTKAGHWARELAQLTDPVGGGEQS